MFRALQALRDDCHDVVGSDGKPPIKRKRVRGQGSCRSASRDCEDEDDDVDPDGEQEPGDQDTPPRPSSKPLESTAEE